MADPVLVPQDNPNDETVVLVEWVTEDGAHVAKDQVLCVLESTKSTFEVAADHEGFLRHLAAPGTDVAVGAPIAALLTSLDEAFDASTFAARETPSAGAPPPARPGREVGATKKAQILAKKAGVALEDIAAWKGEANVTEADVQGFIITQQPEPHVAHVAPTGGRVRVIVVGAGMGANQVLDAMSRVPGLLPVGIVDDDPARRNNVVYGTPVIGTLGDLGRLYAEGAVDAACISIAGSMRARQAVIAKIAGVGVPRCNVVDPSVVVSLGAKLGQGNFVSALSRLGPDATLGDDNYLSSYVSIEHHCTVGDSCTFGPGVMLSGQVTVGSGVKFGTGVFVEPHLHIGDGATIASGAIITKDVPAGAIVKVPSNTVVRPGHLSA
jgi:sugar O-acyltransferase (sialic acid O-acetyltransferase NeuD family)